jgi:hypothetical protein
MSPLRQEVERVLREIPIDFGGGCSVSKAYVIAWLIRRSRFRTSADIGVYRGRSLFPQAVAHRLFTGGTVYGIDPWCAEQAREYDNEELKEAISRFADETDFESIYRKVDALRHEFGCQKSCQLLRKTSSEAASYFKEKGTRFDLIHIDGNHDTQIVMRDVELYWPLLNKNGFIVMDDVSWKSVRPAYEALNRSMSLVFERVDAENDYAVFWNGSSRLSSTMHRAALRRVGQD